jgi:hydroxypyruvate isomerase
MARLRGAYESALPLAEAAGKILLLEPFNEFNHPGHFIYGSPEALEICRAVDSPHLKLNWDLFHMQRHEGELVQRLRDGIDQIAYFQVADAPDRHQPGTGEVNYEYVFAEARKAGYKGYFGLECWPKDGDNEQAVKDVRAIAPEA